MLLLQIQLILHQLPIFASQSHQLPMCTCLYDLPCIQYHYFICIFYRTQSVGYDDDRFILKKLLEIFHDDALIGRIESIGRFVKKQIFRVFIHCPGYDDALPLPL